MPEPTSKYTFYDLILKVAREAGEDYHGSTGQGKAVIPVDAEALQRIKEIVNDGIKMFMEDAPVKGWRWQRRIASIDITGTRDTGTADAADSTSLTDLTLCRLAGPIWKRRGHRPRCCQHICYYTNRDSSW